MGEIGRARLVVTAVLLGLLGGASPTQAVMVPPSQFEDQLVTKLISGTALVFTPDGRLLIPIRDGVLRVYNNGALRPTPALNIVGQVCSNQERGLLGAAIHPSFATNHYVYLYYTFKKFGDCATSGPNTPVNRVSRFVLGDNDIVDPASEVVLIDNIPSPLGLHNAGDLQFGKDGYLYASTGDGGCDFRGDSGCYTSNDASRDLGGLNGKILRITGDGGIPASNPYQGNGTVRCNVNGSASPEWCQEVLSFGLRNPWRMAFDPNAAGTLFHINDVGAGNWEEVDVGQSAADYGWNLREGPCATESYTDCGPPPLGHTNPIYSYDHTTNCTAITGGAFVPAGIWPAEYDDAYLFSDVVCGKIFRLIPSSGGGGFTASEFATPIGLNKIVSMTFGPHAGSQALYYITYGDGTANTYEIRRIAFTGNGNHAPAAVVGANPTSGEVPLTVNFDGANSSDPDDDPLTYEWDFGDGSPPVTGATATHTYTAEGIRTATLRVRDDHNGEDTATVQIHAGNRAPLPTIQAPSPTKRFRVGEQINLAGSATDPDDGVLPGSALSFEVIKHHATHFHPFLPPTQGRSASITGPQPEDINSTQNSYLEIILTATDDEGLSASISQELRPSLVDLTFETNPIGLQLRVGGSTVTAPRTIPSWESWVLTVAAPDQSNSSNTPHTFASWSDGGARAHTISTSASPATYRATFVRAGYARPTAASPATIRLVPAYRQCVAQNASGSHGAPLNNPSCDRPAQESATLTVGTPESNGFRAEGTGRVILKVICTDSGTPPCSTDGDTQDVSIDAVLTDVRCNLTNAACPGGFGSDYVGKLLLKSTIRITDRLNGVFGSAAGTVSDVPFVAPLDCVATAASTVGGNCSLTTTADALYPGVVREQSRAIWALGAIDVLDAGPNGSGYGAGCPQSCGDGDEQVFMRQGLFAP